MRRRGVLVLVLLCAGLGGCFSVDPARPASWLSSLRGPRVALGADGILLDLVLLEKPLGDPFLNDEIWRFADCQVVGLERQDFLENNGFRAGLVVGMNPAPLQNLLDSPRHWIGSRRQILTAGHSTGMTLGPTQSECEFRLKTENGDSDVLLDQAQCTLLIEPSLTGDGRTKLKFTPQVAYGAVVPDYRAAADKSGWLLQYKRPSKTYAEVSWEVTLGPNQYAVIGTHFDDKADEDAPRTLGSHCFLPGNGKTFTQRLLVVRTTRGTDEGDRRPMAAGPAAESTSLAVRCASSEPY